MRTEDRINDQLQKLVNNYLDIPPDEHGDNKIHPMEFRYLSLHQGCRYKITIELEKYE